jgi:DNA-binding transcriptional regulator/RsmH inhibitor MraZ
MFDSRCDEKGRLKLNEEIRRYFVESGNTRLFITSFDARTALIYPIALWEEAEQLLESPGPHAKAGKALWLKSQKYGGDAEIDNQGRVLLPAKLRKEMGVESAPVHMAFFRGHLEVYSSKELETLDQAASGNTDEMLETFVNLGLR